MSLSDYRKQHDFLICVDSDGCAMDTMDIKHFTCFGPCMIAEWGLGEWEEALLKRWNDVNLYTMTRGINRFKGLAILLSEVDANLTPVPGVAELARWSKESPELSNDALERVIAAGTENGIFGKALSWSRAVNAKIKTLPPEEVKPFPLAKEALAFAHERADVAIVSSANPGAVLEEWERFGLLDHTDIVMAQDVGSKAFCIAQMLQKGYDPSHVLMCGDAPGDLQAAEKNGVFYYPILVGREAESWREFMDKGFDALLAGEYGGDYQNKKKNEFLDNLGGK